MKIIAQNYQEDKAVSDSINIFFKTYKISSILRAANAYKKKGIAVTSIFMYLFSLIFTQRSMYINMLMGKKSSKIHYLYNGKMQSVTKIYQQNKKRCGRSKYLLSAQVSVVKDDEIIPVRVVYVRNRNKKKDYLVLITTDMNLG